MTKTNVNASRKKILILSSHNACRGPMAHGFVQKMTGESAEVYSAGVEKNPLQALAVKVMLEKGIDIKNHPSHQIDELRHIEFDFVLTVCDSDRERIPYYPSSALKYACDFIDPCRIKGTEEEVYHAFCTVRDEIEVFCQNFVSEHIVVTSYKTIS